MTTVSGAIVSIISGSGSLQEGVENGLHQHLVRGGFGYVGPRSHWNRSYRYGSRRLATLAFRLQRRQDGLWLYARPSSRYVASSLWAVILFEALYLIAGISSIIAFRPSFSWGLVALLYVPTLSVLVAYAWLRRITMREVPAMRAAYREARDAAFSELAVKVEVRDARMPFNYLDSLSFEREHPQKIYAGNTYDIGALLLGLVLPALAGVYLLLRRRGGRIRLVYSLLLSFLYVFTVYRFLLQGYYPGAAPAFIITTILLRALTWVPIYQCGNCGRQWIYNLTSKCPQCKTKL